MDDDTSNANRSDDMAAKLPSQLFTVRIWPEIVATGVVVWRGKVQHVPNGAWRYFQEWQALTAFLQTQIEALATETQ